MDVPAAVIERHGSALWRIAATLVDEVQVEPVVIAACRRFASTARELDPTATDRAHLLRALGEVTGRSLGDGEIGPAGPPFEETAFYPDGHRWEGDWREEPVPPEDAPPKPRPWNVPEAPEAMVEAALASLPGVPRRVLILRDCEGWDLQDASGALGITESDAQLALDVGRWAILRALDAGMR